MTVVRVIVATTLMSTVAYVHFMLAVFTNMGVRMSRRNNTRRHNEGDRKNASDAAPKSHAKRYRNGES